MLIPILSEQRADVRREGGTDGLAGVCRDSCAAIFAILDQQPVLACDADRAGRHLRELVSHFEALRAVAPVTP